ncbi:hypothetical protein GGR90_002995 [Sphingopyxis italica]|uniref:Uncharacterized protein n=2 Tax=Sphingopyxis TaxID=165697 RepID=A0AAC9AXH7_SPHMC|nr:MULTISPECIES: hypothetical protein [Sphingopyxis]ALJ15526.1 hypothetical protein LH19_21855 [Sphingopyxis macrogoltabida]AMU91767.1 hypothetical protein ATM17_22410 [Sphingopyxis macrogoltabida]NJB90793.1 hypothetical protein [Sphingopyxis italica]
MSPMDIYCHAPLGAKIRFSNGEPRPPDRCTRKVKAWENDNGTGTLIEYRPGCESTTYSSPPTFALHLATYSSGGVQILVVRRIYSVVSRLDFEIVERPRPGMARVLTVIGEGDELRHLAADEAAAQAWLGEHRYHNARIELVDDPDAPNRPLFRGRAAA